MASSGTFNYSLTVGEGIISAYERVQIRTPSIRQEHMVTARRETNLLFAEWANKQVNLWEVILVSETLTESQATYDVDAKVVMILDAYISLDQGETTQTDRYITPVSRTDYASYSNKSTEGFPTTFWFNRQIEPTVTLWPVPDSNGPYTLNYYACTQMQDANIAGAETPDIPYLWNDAFVAGLAHRLARVYKPELEPVRKADAKEAWDIAATQNTENVSLSLVPGLSGYYR